MGRKSKLSRALKDAACKRDLNGNNSILGEIGFSSAPDNIPPSLLLLLRGQHACEMLLRKQMCVLLPARVSLRLLLAVAACAFKTRTQKQVQLQHAGTQTHTQGGSTQGVVSHHMCDGPKRSESGNFRPGLNWDELFASSSTD